MTLGLLAQLHATGQAAPASQIEQRLRELTVPLWGCSETAVTNTDCVIEKNIFYCNAVTLGRGDGQGIDFVSAGGGHVLRDNLFYGPEKTSIPRLPGNCIASNNVEDKDPLFVDAERCNFHLRSDSMAMGRGAHGAISQDGTNQKSIEFFVSPYGNDARTGQSSNPGATNGPFATLERARDAIRALRQTQKTPIPVRVTIRGGTYFLNQTVEFGPQDSGSEAGPVVYVAAAGEKVVLSGGRRLENGQWGEVRKGKLLGATVSGTRRVKCVPLIAISIGMLQASRFSLAINPFLNGRPPGRIKTA